jgi:hypothetical protein
LTGKRRKNVNVRSSLRFKRRVEDTEEHTLAVTRVTWWVCEKIAQPIIMSYFYCGKEWAKNSGYCCN